MNWYKIALAIIKIAELEGEWWIFPDGRTTFADSTTGDYNHEAIAIEHAQAIVKDAMIKDRILREVAEFIFGRTGHWEEYDPIETRSELLDWADMASKEGTITEDEADDIYETIIKRTEINSEVLEVAMGLGGETVGKEYAIKEWKWKRVAKNNVETFSLTAHDRSVITQGLINAYGDIVEKYKFNISIIANGNFLIDVPFDDIQTGSLTHYVERF